MPVLDTAKARSSVRAYTGQAVEEEKLQMILEAAHVAPTAANMQPVRLVVVRSREGLSAVSESANIYGAPVAVVVCADKSVWICYFKPDVLKQGLGLPENLEPVNILALGYSAEPGADKDRHSQTRIPMGELVQYK